MGSCEIFIAFPLSDRNHRGDVSDDLYREFNSTNPPNEMTFEELLFSLAHKYIPLVLSKHTKTVERYLSFIKGAQQGLKASIRFEAEVSSHRPDITLFRKSADGTIDR